MDIYISSLTVLTFAIFAIIYKQSANVRAYSFFKPLTTTLILFISLLIYLQTQRVYSAITSISIVLCLVGDIFLLNKKYFLHGLFFFLFAHIGFTAGFASISGFTWNIVPLILLVIFGVTYFIFLRKNLNKYTIPVAIYISVIIIMNWQAINLFIVNKTLVFGGVAFAALLFLFSDSIIAFNKFKKSFRLAEILILTSYWISIYIFTIAGRYII
jgi:uncharacterized membrane protein YhhN